MSDVLQVRMLGGFTVEKNGQSVGDNNNRMRKVWLLLAYLIYSRNTGVSQENYLNLLQGAGNEETADPNGRLKAMLYRVRTLLGQV